MEMKYRSDRCLNLLQHSHHKAVSISKLRTVSSNLLQELGLQIKYDKNMRICTTCRLKMRVWKGVISPSPNVASSSSTSSNKKIKSVVVRSISDGSNSDTDMSVVHETSYSLFQETLSHVGESPIAKRKLKQQKYVTEKIRKVEKVVKHLIFNKDSSSELDEVNEECEKSILVNVMKAFSQTDSSDKKIKIKYTNLLSTMSNKK